MKLIKNTGNDRVMDALRSGLSSSAQLDFATPSFSVFAFAEFAAQLQNLSVCRLVLPASPQTDLQLLGSASDRAFRNQLTARWLARRCTDWIANRVEVRNTPTALPQSSLIASDSDPTLSRAITGHCPFTTDGLGLTPGNPFSLIQSSETADESATLQAWFSKLWERLPASPAPGQYLLAQLAETLEASVDHLKTDRTESGILFELLLKLGLDLTVPIETKTIGRTGEEATGRGDKAGKSPLPIVAASPLPARHQVHSIGAGTLLVCLSKSIAAQEVEPLALGIAAWHKTQAPAGESTIVFRDSAFADDVAKTNLTAILQQHGLENVRSL